jgi:hypothetical protein
MWLISVMKNQLELFQRDPEVTWAKVHSSFPFWKNQDAGCAVPQLQSGTAAVHIQLAEPPPRHSTNAHISSDTLPNLAFGG